MQIEKYIDAWRYALTLAKVPGTWVPILVLAGVKGLVVVAMYFFREPALATILTPVLQSFFGESAVHFPSHVLLLGTMYARADLVITTVLGFPLIGWSLVNMTGAPAKGEADAGPGVGRVIRRAAGLFVVLGLFTLASKGLPILSEMASASVSNPRLKSVVALVGLAVSLGTTGVLLYAPAFFVSRGSGVRAAIETSRRYARQWDGFTGLVVATGWAVRYPCHYVAANAGRLLVSSGPESVFVGLLGGVALDAAALYFVFVAAVSMLSGARANAGGG